MTLAANTVSTAGGATNSTASVINFNILNGDATRDGLVDFSDLLILAQNYGQSGRSWSFADFDYNGVVDFGDLLILAQHYGTALQLFNPGTRDSDETPITSVSQLVSDAVRPATTS